ncbi:helix-turn-helix domain-containing protein [Neoaquamicrobium sediminum]
MSVIPADAGPRINLPMGGVVHATSKLACETLAAEAHFAGVMFAPVLACRSADHKEGDKAPVAPTGALIIHPENVEARTVWSYARESLVVAIKPTGLIELAADEFRVESITLRPPRFGAVDTQAFGIAELLKAELAQASFNDLYVDSLFTAFAIHLLRNYAETHQRRPKLRGRLSPQDAKRVREFLDENLSRKLAVAELAALVGLSQFHFIRAFSKTFGEPPHRYVLKLRLDFAEKLLIGGDSSIAEIAYLSGFSSQSHLTAAMKKYRRVTPAEYRQNAHS